MAQDPNQVEYVTVLTPNDVLFGRGSGPNDHEGNIRFRDMVAQRKAEYMATNHRQTKAKIAKSIVDAVFASNGRFLKKLEPAEVQQLGLVTNSSDIYVVADDDTIMEKAKQALRQNRDKNSDISAVASAATGSGSGGPPPRGRSRTPPRPPTSSSGSTSPHFQQQQQQQQQQHHTNNQHHNNHLNNRDRFDLTNTAEPYSIRSQHAPTPAMMNPMMPNSAGTAMLPMVPNSHVGSSNNNNPYHFSKRPNYREDSEGYATYITPLEDPEDDNFFAAPSTRRQSSNSALMVGSIGTTGSRRGSLLGGRKDARRESLPMTDVWRRESLLGNIGESMQMSELMESFKGMSTSEMNSSDDTIGTIEGNGFSSNQMSGFSSMSIVSMSSAASLFKTPSTDDPEIDILKTADSTNSTSESPSGAVGEMWNHPNNTNNASRPNHTMPPPPVETSNQRASMIPSDLWNSGALNNLLQAPIDGSSALLDASGMTPRGLQMMEEHPDSMSYLGTSSMSILQAAEISDRVLPLERK